MPLDLSQKNCGALLEQKTTPEARDVDLGELEERFKRYVYAHNGKVTNERLALLRALYENDGHFSVDQLLELMQQQSFRISRATVYRTLDLLVNSGLIRKLIIEGQDTRYESSLTSGHHDHIICIDCHKITEFFSPSLEQIQDEILEQHRFKHIKHVHQLYGSCQNADCPSRKIKENANGLVV